MRTGLRFPRLGIATFRRHPRNGRLVRHGDHGFNAPNVAAIVNSFLRARLNKLPTPSTMFVNNRKKGVVRVLRGVGRILLPSKIVMFGSISRRDGTLFAGNVARVGGGMARYAHVTISTFGPVRVVETRWVVWGEWRVGTVVLVSRTDLPLTGALRERLPSALVCAGGRYRNYVSVASYRQFVRRRFGSFSDVVFVNTVKVYMHDVTKYVGGGCGSPTIIYISDAKHFIVSMLSKRIKKTGRLAHRVTTVAKKRTIVAARDSGTKL